MKLTCVTPTLTSLLTPDPALIISPFRKELPPLRKPPIRILKASSRDILIFPVLFCWAVTQKISLTLTKQKLFFYDRPFPNKIRILQTFGATVKLNKIATNVSV